MSMESLPVILRTYDLYKAVVEITHHCKKQWRYSLGQSLEHSILDMLSELIMAKNAPKPLKAGYLIKAGAHQETIMFKLRLLLELKIANETNIFKAQELSAEIGRMLGGWRKSVLSS